jgi:hypothetical protein
MTLTPRWDDDWHVLRVALKHCSEFGTLRFNMRELIREILSKSPVLTDPDWYGLTNNPKTVIRIERKFWSLIEASTGVLRYKQLPTTNEAIIEEARRALTTRFGFAGVTEKELRIIFEAERIWESILIRARIHSG